MLDRFVPPQTVASSHWHYWSTRIDRSLQRDRQIDEENEGNTPHLDAMYRALESEHARYQSMACVRDVNPVVMIQIDDSRQAYKTECVRLCEFRETAKDARNNHRPNDWPDNYQALVGMVNCDRVLSHLGMKRTGRRWTCPRCQRIDKGRRGTIDANGPKWYCFSCKEGGIAPTLLQHAGYNYQDSVSLCLGLV